MRRPELHGEWPFFVEVRRTRAAEAKIEARRDPFTAKSLRRLAKASGQFSLTGQGGLPYPETRSDQQN